MKLILTQEVGSLGGPGDLVEVKDGYGRNYLVPRGLAIVATRGAEKQVAQIRRSREVREIRDIGQARAAAASLAALPVQLQVRAGNGGRLFGSVTSTDVAAAVFAAGGPKLDRRRIELAEPIKVIGEYPVTVRLHNDVVATMTVSVVAAN
jgi:large subunit ribosomal protein L9